MTSLFAQVGDAERRTAHESVLLALRRAILSGILPGGTRLVQADLAAQLGVSNTPVREAMRQLATEGLIQFDSYRGAVVHTPTMEEVREIYEARLLLEPMVIRKTVERITGSELRQARAIQEEMTQIRDVGTWVLLNRRFHGTLIGSRSPRLASIISGLQDAATPQVALSIKANFARLTDGNDEHLQILDAVESRDPDLAAETVTAHLRGTVRALESFAESVSWAGAGG